MHHLSNALQNFMSPAKLMQIEKYFNNGLYLMDQTYIIS